MKFNASANSRYLWIWILLALIALPAWFAWEARGLPHLGHFHDDGIYFGTAHTWASGLWHRIESAPGMPVQTRFPPLFPMLMASWLGQPVVALFGLYLLAVGAAVAWVRQAGFAPRYQLAVAVGIGTSPYFVLFAASFMSEMLALTFTFAAFLALLWRPLRSQWMVYVAAALFASGAYLTRTALLAVPVGIVVYLLFRKNLRGSAIFALTCLPALVGWNWFVKSYADPNATGPALWYTNYAGFYAQNVTLELLPTVIWKNLTMLLQASGGLLYFNTGDSIVDINVARLFVFGAVSGLFRLRVLSAYHVVALVYVAELLVWNYVPHERLLLPLLPLLLLGLFRELEHFAQLVQGSWQKQRGAAIVIGGVLAVGLLSAAYKQIEGTVVYVRGLVPRYEQLLASKQPAFAWIRDNTPPTARFLAYDEATLHRYTGRTGWGMHFPTKLYYQDNRPGIVAFFAGAAEVARQQGLDYLLLTPNDFEQDLSPEEREQVAKQILATPGLRTVFEKQGVRVVAVR